MPGYNTHAPIAYSFGTFDFGGGANEVFTFKGPKGKTGTLVDYGYLAPTETFAGSSSTGMIAIGNSSDPDAYGEELDSGTLAADAGSYTVRNVCTTQAQIDAYILNYGALPADTSIYVTCTACVGTPTGMAIPWVLVEWQV